MKHRWTIFVALLVAFLMGPHWPALQVVAWTGMTLKNAHHMPLGAAIAKTIRGDRPCVVCRFVQEGQQTEKKQRDTLHVEQLEGIQQATIFHLRPDLVFQTRTLPPGAVLGLKIPPPLPPPRVA